MMKLERNLVLREAGWDDGEFLFQLRNDSEVRKNSFTKEAITYTSHLDWFTKKLQNPGSKIYILENMKNKVGQVRIDKKCTIQMRQVEGYISYAIAAQHRGNGYGIEMLKLLETVVDEEIELVGEVERNNIISQNIFMELGYKEEETDYGYEYRKKVKK